MLLIIVCILLFGCKPDENPGPNPIDNFFSRILLYVREVTWKIDNSSSTELEKFATKLWMDRVKDNLTLSNTGQALEIQVKSSSFIDLPGTVEFYIKLLCKTKNSNIGLKIKVKGKKSISTVGATIDKIASEIAQEVLDRLKAEYGNANLSKGQNIPLKPVYRKQNIEDLMPTPTKSDKPEKKMSQEPIKVETVSLIQPANSAATNSTASNSSNSIPFRPDPVTTFTPSTPTTPTKPTPSVDLLAQSNTNTTASPTPVTSTAPANNPSPIATTDSTTNLIEKEIQSANTVVEKVLNAESAVSSEIKAVENVLGANPADAGNRYLRLAT